MEKAIRQLLTASLIVMTVVNVIGCSQYRETATAPAIKVNMSDNPLMLIFSEEEVETEQEKNFDEIDNSKLSS